ncbi:hypothetical protein [Marinilabilia salmonicolor]|nr:hypothetical protein [Marinilabilia salmonicolor]
MERTIRNVPYENSTGLKAGVLIQDYNPYQPASSRLPYTHKTAVMKFHT